MRTDSFQPEATGINRFADAVGCACPLHLAGITNGVVSFGPLRYRTRRIGGGAEGQVYRADCSNFDEQHISDETLRCVAIKVMKPGHSATRERNVLRRLAITDRPPRHAEMLYDPKEHEADDVLVLRFIPGCTLLELFQNTRSLLKVKPERRLSDRLFPLTFWDPQAPDAIDLRKVRHTALSLAEALDQLAATAIVNIDQHTNNIMIERGSGEAWLIDVGYASKSRSSRWVGLQTCSVALLQGQPAAKGYFHEMRLMILAADAVSGVHQSKSALDAWAETAGSVVYDALVRCQSAVLAVGECFEQLDFM